MREATRELALDVGERKRPRRRAGGQVDLLGQHRAAGRGDADAGGFDAHVAAVELGVDLHVDLGRQTPRMSGLLMASSVKSSKVARRRAMAVATPQMMLNWESTKFRGRAFASNGVARRK